MADNTNTSESHLYTADRRIADVSFDDNGDRLGVAIFLADEDIKELEVGLGIKKVRYWVEDGVIQCEEADVKEAEHD